MWNLTVAMEYVSSKLCMAAMPYTSGYFELYLILIYENASSYNKTYNLYECYNPHYRNNLTYIIY